MKLQSTHPLLLLALLLLAFILVNEFANVLLSALASDGILATDTYLLTRAAFKILYTLLSFWGIKKFNLLSLAGLGNEPFKNWYLLLFPLYLVLVTGPDPGEIDFAAIPIYRFGVLLCYVITIGFAEEYMLRGFVQSYLLKHFGQTKKRILFSVLGGAFLFGLLHLLRFDKGLYGEIAQVMYATFIGVMFGALLLRTNKIWPLVALHALIDFINNFDYITSETINIHASRTNTSAADALVIILVVLPCFIYGLVLLKKVKATQIQQKITESNAFSINK